MRDFIVLRERTTLATMAKFFITFTVSYSQIMRLFCVSYPAVNTLTYIER